MTVNFSELVNKNRSTLALLDDNPGIRLHRRDGEDLVLTTVERYETHLATVSDAHRFLIALTRMKAWRKDVLEEVLPSVYPWVRFLPEPERAEFAAELADLAEAADSIGNQSALPTLVAAWRHTAEIHADPVLHRVLNREYGDDFGEVPEPGAPEAAG
ncbi:hypothetical protein [Stackebrandtia albiflava]|uniref:hypothetical protein n=1 Tax=Stackebrandtia albiflava TaxID=406432 RepID=UPI001B86B143|nr:hypothetical protein [Stackebrandtia albiflava]